MYIKEITLKDFRNYKDLHTSFHPRVNIFLGKNAQGKTNLLEGIYLNAMARSFKTTRDKDLIRFGEEFCRIHTVSKAFDEEMETEILITKEGKKIIKIDGVKASKTSQLLERIYIVIFSPEDLKIVKDEPEKRRRFIDRELCQIKPGYYSDLSSYKKVLKQRNMYLKEREIDTSVLDIWDYELARYGSRIIRRREEFIKKIGNKKFTIQRSKGLGENEPDMMSLTTMNPSTRRLIKVLPDDAKRTSEIFDILLGDNLDGRKEYIVENGAKYIDNIDVS